MDGLEDLKRDWQQNKNAEVEFSTDSIETMIYGKSSSIVKILLMVSLLEFCFWMAVTFLLNDDSINTAENYETFDAIINLLNTVNYIVLIVFIVLFFLNYRNINSTDSVRGMMQTIIRTSKTVHLYILYNLGYAIVNIGLAIYMLYNFDANVQATRFAMQNDGRENLFIVGFSGLSAVFLLVIVVIFWLFYKLLYGLMLNRLMANYRELSGNDH